MMIFKVNKERKIKKNERVGGGGRNVRVVILIRVPRYNIRKRDEKEKKKKKRNSRLIRNHK
jgi:hypothetical protein